VGAFHSFGDKLELLCLITVLLTYETGFLSSYLQPQEGTAFNHLISVIAMFCLGAPPVGAKYFNSKLKKELEELSEMPSESTEAAAVPIHALTPTSQPRERIRTANPLTELSEAASDSAPVRRAAVSVAAVDDDDDE